MLERACDFIERGIADGLHIGAQLYVSRAGQTIADWAIGEARAGVPLRPESVVVWQSSGKPLTAIAVAQLWERGALQLDDPVAAHLPEFGANDKEHITIRQLLTHTSGFPNVELPRGESWDEILDRIFRAPAIPGKAAYHPASSWFVLGELVHRKTGDPVEIFATKQIFQPLGVQNSSLAMSHDQAAALGDRLAVLFNTAHGKREPHPWDLPTAPGWGQCNPGGSARGPIRELGHFYEALLRGGAPLVSPETLTEFTKPQRIGLFDQTFQHVLDWGLGFIIDSNRYGAETVPYGYGRHCSPRTFGHSGFESSCGFCDPAHGLVVAWFLNGTCGFRRHNQRARDLNSLIYEDLGLALHAAPAAL